MASRLRNGFLVGGVIMLLVSLAVAASAAADSHPNIVLVLADDLGYGDLACFGAKDVQTPNLDRFATEGLRLSACYAGHGNCSPSRTALMTGRTPTRVGVRNWIPQDSPVHLRSTEVTIATLLKNAGYATCHVGKWHLNGEFNRPTQPQPGNHGFEHWFSTQNNALPSHRNVNNFVRNGEPVGKLEGYSADLVVEEARRWLTDVRDKSKPFFLYVCFHEPHEPIASDEKYTKLYPSDDPAYSAHHGNITQMDAALGRLMKLLDDQKLIDNTLVWFTSDNGPAITPQHPHGSAGPLRDKKGSLYEGGIRVPGILRWPGKISPQSTSDEPVCGVDFLPTVCSITGTKPPSDRTLDGTSILPVFAGKPVERATQLYWHFPQASGAPKVAMRVGDWKILATIDKPPQARTNDVTVEEETRFKEAELAEFSLYNLRRDIGETTDLSKSEPAKLAELKSLLQRKYLEVRTESPVWPAWKFTNAEGPRIERPNYPKKKEKAAPRLPRDNLMVYRGANKEVLPVKNVDDWKKRKAEIRAGMETIMGPLPGDEKRCPLDVKIEEEFDGGSYVRRLITYASEPGSRVPAYLLIPKVLLQEPNRKAPAVLCLHGTDNVVGHGVVVGLGNRPNRQYASELAERGYVTLAPNYPLLAKYQPDLKQLGWESGTLKAVWDNMRGIDLLESLPFVQRGSFGAIGHSLGGHNSVYTSVFDDRIKVIVSSCGLDSYLDYYSGDEKNWFPEKGWCQTRYMLRLADYRGRLSEIPFDFHELIGSLAPRHVLIIAPLKDHNFQSKSVDRIFDAAQPVFRLYGHESHLRVEHPDCEHDFPAEMRELAYKQIDEVLGGKNDQ